MIIGQRFTRLRVAQALLALAALCVSVATLETLVHSRGEAGFEWVNHDVANILYLGKRMLAGDRLYTDLAETNPPGIFYLAESIAAVAAATQVSQVFVFDAFVVLLALFGLWLIQRLYARADRPLELSLVGGAFLLVFSGCGLPGDRMLAACFGQREHLFALAFIPYLLWRLSGQPLSTAAWLISGAVGFLASMKPHFAILVVALELCCWSEDRLTLRRVWPVLIAAAVLPYALLLLNSPASLATFFRETIPLHTGGSYAYFDQPYSLFLHSAQHVWLVVYGVAIGYALWSGAQLSRAARRTVYLLPPLAYALIVQQHKFWDYHAIVLESLLAVLSAYLGAALIARLPAERAVPLFGLLMAALALGNWRAVAELRAMTGDWKHGIGVDARLMKVAPLLRGRRRVLYYSTSISHMQLALLLGQRTVGRWSHDLLYPSLVRAADPARRPRLLAQYCAEQQQLIATQKPDAVVFHSTRQGLESREQELFSQLVERCKVIPELEYSAVFPEKVPGVAVFLRR